MMFLFTKSEMIGSKAICWALKEPVSHVAVVFDEGFNGKNRSGIVFHSHFSGAQFSWLEHFAKSNRPIFGLRPRHLTLELEEKIFQTVVRNFYGKEYDSRLFAEFVYHALRYRFKGIPIPRVSKLDSTDSFLCTELAARIANEIPHLLGWHLQQDGMISPYQLYLSMRNSPSIERVIDL
jgi:hypothetical protein